MADLLSDLDAVLAQYPAPATPKPKTIFDEIDRVLAPYGPQERAQIQTERTARDVEDVLRLHDQPTTTPPLRLGLPSDDPRLAALSDYKIKTDLAPENPAKRDRFIRDRIIGIKNGAELPGIFTDTDALGQRQPGVLSDELTDPQKTNAILQRFKGWSSHAYTILHASASGSEQLQAIHDGLQQWLAGNLVQKATTPGLPREAYGRFAGPGGPPAAGPPVLDKVSLQLPPTATEADLQDLYARWQGTGTTKFNTKDQQLFDALHGADAFRFVESRLPYFTARNRLEKYLGHLVEDRRAPRTININQADPDQDQLTQIPPTFPLQLAHLAEKDPDLAYLAQISAQSQEAKQYGSSRARQFKYGLNLGISIPGYRPGEGFTTRAAAEDFFHMTHDPAFQRLKTPSLEIPGTVPGELALQSPEISSQFLDLINKPITLTVGALFNKVAELTFGAGDKITQAFTGQPDMVTTGTARLLGFFTRGIAPQFSQDARNDRDFAGRLLDQLPSGSSIDDAKDILKLQDSGSALHQMLVAAGQNNIPVLSRLSRELVDNPYTEQMTQGFAEVVDQPASALALLLGTGTVLSRLTRGVKAIPSAFNRYTKYDFVSQTGAAAETARGALIQAQNAAIMKLRRPTDASAYVARMLDMLKTEGGGTTAADTGILINKLTDIKTKTDALGDAHIRQDTREALLDAVHPITNLGPTEAIYTFLGKSVPLGAAEGTRIYGKLLDAADRLQAGKLPEAPPILKTALTGPELNQVFEAWSNYHAQTAASSAARERIQQLVTQVADQIQTRAAPRHQQVSDLYAERDHIIHSTNDEIQQTLVDRAQAHMTGGTYYTPDLIEHPIPPAPDPTLSGHLAKITQKLQTAQDANRLVKLTNDELSILNQYKNSPLDLNQAHATHDALLTDLKTHQTSIATDTKNLAELSNFHTILRDIDPTNPKLKIKLSPSLYKILHEELGRTAQEISGDRYVSLHPGFRTETLSAIDAFHEFTGKIRQDLALAGGPMKRFSAFNASILFNAGDGSGPWAMRRIARDVEDWEKFILHRADTVIKTTNKRMTFDEAIAQTKAASEGKPSLFTDPYVRRLRETLFDAQVHAGILDRETAAQFINEPAYYHGHYDAEDIKELPREAPLPWPSKYRRLKVDGDYLKAAIPETDGYHAVWKDDHGGQHFKEFATRDAAAVWLNSDPLPIDTSVDIRKNLSFSEKTIRGISGDIRTSFGELIRKQAKDAANAELAFNLSRTPYVKSAAAADLSHFKFDNSRAIDPATGAIWHQIDNPKALHLDGKWVHSDVLEWLRLHDVGSGLYSAMSAGIQDGSGLWDLFKPNVLMNRMDAIATRLLGTSARGGALQTLFVRVPSNVVAWSKVAMSPSAWARQWPANILNNMRAAGFETLAPTGIGDYFSTLKRAIGALLGKHPDPRLDELLRNGNINLPKSGFLDTLDKIADDYRRDPEALQARIKFHRTEATAFEQANKFDEASEQLVRANALEGRLIEVNKTAMGGFMRAINSSFGQWMVDAFIKGPFLAKGKVNTAAWNVFSLPDNISKLQTHIHLVETQGLSAEDSLSRIDAHMQNLHRAPQWVKNLTNSMGGGLFVSYNANQLYTSLNAFKYRPLWALANLGLLNSWNRLMLHQGGEDPTDAANAWSMINYGTRANFLTEQAFLTSRMLFPGGRGGIHLGNALFDIFTPQSLTGKHVQTLINKSNQPDLFKAGESIANGMLSKYLFNTPAMAIAANLVKGTDDSGRPYTDLGNATVDILQRFTPGALTDAYKVYQKGTGQDINTYTGERRKWTDYITQRVFSAVNPVELTDEALIKAAIQLVTASSREPGKWISEANEEPLRAKLRMDSSYLGDGKWAEIPGRLQQIAKDHLLAKGRSFPGLDNQPIPQAHDPAAILGAIQTAKQTGMVADLHRLALSEQLMAYAHAHAIRPILRSPAIEQTLRAAIVHRIESTPLTPTQSANLAGLLNNITADQTLPAGAKMFLQATIHEAQLRYNDEKAHHR